MNKLYRPAKRIARSRIKCKATRKQIEVGDQYIKAQGYGAFAVGSEPKSQEEADQYRFPSNPKPKCGDAAVSTKPSQAGDQTVRPPAEYPRSRNVLYCFRSVDERDRFNDSDYLEHSGNRWKLDESVDRWLSGDNDFANCHTRDSYAAAPNSPREDSLASLDQIAEQIEQFGVESQACSGRPRRKVVRNREIGDEINIDRYFSGDPVMWSRTEKKTVTQHVVKIGVVCGVSSAESQQNLMYRGAASVAIAEMLQSSGMSVQIDAILSSLRVDSCNRTLTISTTIKDSCQPIDRGVLLANLCDVGYMRVANLTALIRLAGRGIKRGLGMPSEPIAEIADQYDLLVPRLTSLESSIHWATQAASQRLRQ